MAGVLLPRQLIAEPLPVRGVSASVCGCVHPGQGEQAVADMGRQTRRAPPVRWPDLVSMLGIPGEIEGRERPISSCLCAGEPGGSRRCGGLANRIGTGEIPEMRSGPGDDIVGLGEWQRSQSRTPLGARWPMNPNMYPATRRIWISSDPSVIR